MDIAPGTQHPLLTSAIHNIQEPRMNLGSIKAPNHVYTAGISNIAWFYQYTNTPPLALGAPAPKVAESILRGESYNSLPGHGLEGESPTQMWDYTHGPYPTTGITSNFDPPAARDMYKEFLRQNYIAIDECIQKVYREMTQGNSDVLTKGRQTWDSIDKRSVPSAQAYYNMMRVMKAALGKAVGPTCMDFINAHQKMYSLNYIRFKKRKDEIVKKLKRNSRGQSQEAWVRKVTYEYMELKSNDEVRDQVEEWSTSFCAYLKSKERGKLKRRAIASANIALRMYLYLVEYFHLELGKKIDCSTISIGGEDKKQKIIATLNSGALTAYDVSLQATEDATKWNECLAPENFLLMHETFFSNEARHEMQLPPVPAEGLPVRMVFRLAMRMLSKKRIFLGKGHVIHDGSEGTILTWDSLCKASMSDQTREWFEKISPKIHNGYVLAPFGMLMGMLNAASTTLGAVAVKWRIPRGCSRDTIRSSDDSSTVFIAPDDKLMVENINSYYCNLKRMGINISEKKTRFFRKGYGEYTSWYMEHDFTAPYGVETTSLRPQGMCPPDDFNSVASSTANSLRNGTLNIFGASAKLNLGISNCRRLYRITKGQSVRDGVTPQVIFLSDGGPSPWTWANCHLKEACLKMRIAELHGQRQEDIKYLDAVTNPQNPFSGDFEEIQTYNLEMGTVMSMENAIPKTPFHTIRRGNGTKRSILADKEATFQESCDIAVKVVERVAPVCAIEDPTGSITGARYCSNLLIAKRNAILSLGGSFDKKELAQIQKAIDMLNH